MNGSIKPKVKICCISSLEEANIAIECGADALGLVGPMPSGPGVISLDLISTISQSVPELVATFFLTSQTNPQEIINQHKLVNTSTIQIVDEIQLDSYSILREALPAIKLVQVIHVLDEKSIEQALKVAPYVDAVLLDSGNPNLKVKQLGGTGRVHNWDLSKIIRKELNIPVFLAGGLNPSNIQIAVEQVQPFGVDLCSGVRSNGLLDPRKLKAFFDALNSNT